MRTDKVRGHTDALCCMCPGLMGEYVDPIDAPVSVRGVRTACGVGLF